MGKRVDETEVCLTCGMSGKDIEAHQVTSKRMSACSSKSSHPNGWKEAEYVSHVEEMYEIG